MPTTATALVRELRAIPSDDSVRSWRESAKCRGMNPALFFPERGEPGWHARAVCGRCPVRDACLEDALAQGNVPGIWGGMSARERRRIRRERRSAADERATA